MYNKKEILQKRFSKLEKHYTALKEYKELLDTLLEKKNIYDQWTFNTLAPQERAILDAYLKRFASIQDFLGAKIYPLLLERAGIYTNKMSELLSHLEKEELIESVQSWIELREIRNELEHDYPEELEEALQDLRYCIEHFDLIERYYFNAKEFFQRYS